MPLVDLPEVPEVPDFVSDWGAGTSEDTMDLGFLYPEASFDCDTFEFEDDYDGITSYGEFVSFSYAAAAAFVSQLGTYEGGDSDYGVFVESDFVPEVTLTATTKEEVLFSAPKIIAYHTAIDTLVAQNRPEKIFNKTRAAYYTEAVEAGGFEATGNDLLNAVMQGLINYGSTTV